MNELKLIEELSENEQKFVRDFSTFLERSLLINHHLVVSLLVGKAYELYAMNNDELTDEEIKHDRLHSAIVDRGTQNVRVLKQMTVEKVEILAFIRKRQFFWERNRTLLITKTTKITLPRSGEYRA